MRTLFVKKGVDNFEIENRKASFRVGGVMNKLKHYIPYRILHTLYCTLILLYLSYGILKCGNICKSYLAL